VLLPLLLLPRCRLQLLLSAARSGPTMLME